MRTAILLPILLISASAPDALGFSAPRSLGAGVQKPQPLNPHGRSALPLSNSAPRAARPGLMMAAEQPPTDPKPLGSSAPQLSKRSKFASLLAAMAIGFSSPAGAFQDKGSGAGPSPSEVPASVEVAAVAAETAQEEQANLVFKVVDEPAEVAATEGQPAAGDAQPLVEGEGTLVLTDVTTPAPADVQPANPASAFLEMTLDKLYAIREDPHSFLLAEDPAVTAAAAAAGTGAIVLLGKSVRRAARAGSTGPDVELSNPLGMMPGRKRQIQFKKNELQVEAMSGKYSPKTVEWTERESSVLSQLDFSKVPATNVFADSVPESDIPDEKKKELGAIMKQAAGMMSAISDGKNTAPAETAQDIEDTVVSTEVEAEDKLTKDEEDVEISEVVMKEEDVGTSGVVMKEENIKTSEVKVPETSATVETVIAEEEVSKVLEDPEKEVADTTEGVATASVEEVDVKLETMPDEQLEEPEVPANAAPEIAKETSEPIVQLRAPAKETDLEEEVVELSATEEKEPIEIEPVQAHPVQAHAEATPVQVASLGITVQGLEEKLEKAFTPIQKAEALEKQLEAFSVSAKKATSEAEEMVERSKQLEARLQGLSALISESTKKADVYEMSLTESK